jgi:hypothetical protein
VEDAQLTLLVRGKQVAIPRAAIGRVESERRDPLWNGLILGAVLSLGMRAAFSGETCSRSPEPFCTIKGTVVGAGIGAFIDFQIKGHRVIYDARPSGVALLRVRF